SQHGLRESLLSETELSHLLVIDTECALIMVQSHGVVETKYWLEHSEPVQSGIPAQHYRFPLIFDGKQRDGSQGLPEEGDDLPWHARETVRLDPDWRIKQPARLEFILLAWARLGCVTMVIE